MPSAPDIRYARNGQVSIAYQVVGDGPTDLVYVPDYVSNLVYAWESPRYREFYERLARSFRLILFDKRGTGLSDSGGEFATLETRMEDLHAVLDAVGSERAVVFGSHEGASMATLYAATYPERTMRLVLFQPSAQGGHYDESPRERKRSCASCGKVGHPGILRRAARWTTCPTLAGSEETATGSRTGCAWARAPPSRTH